MQNINQTKELLDFYHDKYNNPDFIELDPISIPHQFSKLQDIEISGFLAATIAWGNRKAIVKNANLMIELMDNAPYDFIKNASIGDIQNYSKAIHRTFSAQDFTDFIKLLSLFYTKHDSMKTFFESNFTALQDIRSVLSKFRSELLLTPHNQHCEKHISSIDKKAACKRLNMFLRWMVRQDNRGVDFGLWNKIPASALYLPLDVHTSNLGRALNLLTRKQNDWRAVEEITGSLRMLDSSDPVKYDFALFGAGVNS